MRPRLFSLLAPLLALFLAAPLPAQKSLDDDTLGGLKLGQTAAEVSQRLGKPESKGKNVEWAATGDWVQDWKYPAQGLVLGMGSSTKDGAKTILTITAKAGCKLATSRGIKIGSSAAEVRKAYGDVEARDEAPSTPTSFVAGSIYGGIIFSLKAGKVESIFYGAAAE